MPSMPHELEPVIRLALAVLLGGLLGLEREWRRKAAGLRTHMVVALGAATFTVVGAEVYAGVIEAGPEVARVDLLRVAAAVIGGLGFLGAGSIIQGRGSIEGLTTAGSIWLVGAVGVAAGAGEYVTALAAVVLGLLVLSPVDLLERRLRRGRPPEPAP